MPCGDYCYDVDLLKSIEALLQIDSVMEQVRCVVDIHVSFHANAFSSIYATALPCQ